MKTKRSIVALILAFALCMSLAVGVSATAILSSTDSAGIYIWIRGTISPTSSNTSLPTTTQVKLNPDTAYIRVYCEVKDGTNHLSESTASSSRGVTSFNRTMPLYHDTVNENLYVYVAHNIEGGSQSPTGYVCRTESPLN